MVQIGGMLAYSYYNDGQARSICHILKDRRMDEAYFNALQKAADFLSKGVHEGDVLIPAPQHTGTALYTLDLAKLIAERTGAIIWDGLKRIPEEDNYSRKQSGAVIAPKLYLVGESIPEGRRLFVDNVIATGSTFLTAKALIPGLEPLVYAVDETAGYAGYNDIRSEENSQG